MPKPPAAPVEPAPPDDLELLLAVLPPHLVERLREEPEVDSLLEIVLDLGRTPEARFAERTVELAAVPVSAADLDQVVDRVGRFGQDNRAGIERTLHRISALRNRDGRVVGLTCRVGRAVHGTVDILRDVVERGDSVLLVGRPGVGKTTLLREAARVLADDLGKRVVVVDTSNEIAGDGDIPHPGIGRARRMQVPSPDAQHAVMIEAVENHMPEVVVIDEIGTSAEALAGRTIAERGVQLVATAHGNSLENLLQNPTLADLVGGVQAVTLSDEEARRRRTRKTVLERKAPPTFEVLVEIQAQGRLAVHHRTAEAVDAHLGGHAPRPEVRVRRDDGEVEIRAPEPAPERPQREAPYPGSGARGDDGYLARRRVHRIFPYAVSRSRLERGIRKLGLKARIVSDLDDADLILTTKAQERRQPKRLREAQMGGTPIHVVKSNTSVQLENFLRTLLPPPPPTRGPGGERGDGRGRRAVPRGRGGDGAGAEESEGALSEVENGIERAREHGQPIELAPRDRYLRRLQHELVQRRGLTSRSRGHEPYRRVVVYPI